MKKNYGYMLEMLILLVLSVSMIVAMSGIYARSLAESRKAKRLNDAIIVASNGAEVFLAGNDEEQFAKIFGQTDDKDDGEVRVSFNDELEPSRDGKMALMVRYAEEPDFVYGHFEVYYDDELVYELDTGRARREDDNE